MDKLKNVSQKEFMSYSEEIIRVVDSVDTYIGYSIPGATTENNHWIIKKETVVGDEKFSVYANNDKLYNKIFDNKEAYFIDATDVVDVKRITFHENNITPVSRISWKSGLECGEFLVNVSSVDSVGYEKKYDKFREVLTKEKFIDFRHEPNMDIQQLNVSIIAIGTDKINSGSKIIEENISSQVDVEFVI